MQRLLLIALTAATLVAADATGTWTGTLTPSDGTSGPARLVLKQEGDKVTGTAGPDATEQHTIENGKAESGNLTFQVSTPGGVMKFAVAIFTDILDFCARVLAIQGGKGRSMKQRV